MAAQLETAFPSLPWSQVWLWASVLANVHVYFPARCLECDMVWSHLGPDKVNNLGMEMPKREGNWVPNTRHSVSPGLPTCVFPKRNLSCLCHYHFGLCHGSWLCILTNTLFIPSSLSQTVAGERADLRSLVAISSELHVVLHLESHRLKSRGRSVWMPPWMLWGRVHFQVSSVGWQNSFPVVAGMVSSRLCWLSAGDHSTAPRPAWMLVALPSSSQQLSLTLARPNSAFKGLLQLEYAHLPR